MNSMKYLVTAGLMAITAASACAQSGGTDDWPAADALLEEVRQTDQMPGVMAAVVRDGEVIWSRATGFADLENRLALTTRTRMRIGSVSKPLTAALVLRLADAGRLDLDASIHDYVPEITAPRSGAITPRMIAGHVSGIRQYDFTSIEDANNFLYYPTLAMAFERLTDDPLISTPGEEFHYSSIAYNVLGIAAERAGGAGFAELMQQEITGPLSMDDTRIDHPLEVIDRRTRFYTLFPDGVVLNTIWRDSSDYYPSGGMLSSAEDLALFADALFESELLSSEMQDVLRTEIRMTSGESSGYAFGWQAIYDESGVFSHFEHGGETNGGYAYVRFDPHSGTALAMIANANHAVGEPIFFEAASERLPAIFE